jgi:glycosyltransferase involved in cell wall biosynthesis
MYNHRLEYGFVCFQGRRRTRVRQGAHVIMKVVWVVPRQALKTGPDGLHSDLASIRYRAIIPMQGLVARGHQASIVGLDPDCIDAVREQVAGADRVVFIKNYVDPGCSEQLLQEQRARGVKTLFDLTDDRFKGDASDHLHRMVLHADSVVTVSSALRNTILQMAGKDSVIVGDPYEGPRGTPRWSPDARRLKALWFGYGWNIVGLMRALPSLLEAAKDFPTDLRIVTSGVEGIERYCEKFNRNSGHALALQYVNWSSGETWSSLAATDFVVIPALLDEQWTLAKSSNRIVEALWSGRFVVSHPIPSYLEFKDWAWIGGELADGVRWMMQNATLIPGRIAAAQEYIASAYSPDSIATQWERILETA